VLDLASKELKFIPGVGPARAEWLKKELKLLNQEDLLYSFPYKYIDRTRFQAISELTADASYVQLKGQILSFETLGVGRSKRIKALFTDGTGSLELVWFKGLKYVEDKYKLGQVYVVFGKPSVYGHQLSIAHPDIETPAEQTGQPKAGLQPFYTTT
jgi:ATP-dependent DNA helicase RecG